MKESMSLAPDFESRRAYVEHIKPGTIIESQGVMVRVRKIDNPHFPHWIYGVDVQTGESRSIPLVDGELPNIVENVATSAMTSVEAQNKVVEAPLLVEEASESSSQGMGSYMREAAMATGDPFLGLLLKLYTEEGMSSQLIRRSGERARGDIPDLLPGEQDYEESRHALHVFYQTKSFVDIPPTQRERALEEMLRLRDVLDEQDRQLQAGTHPLFGLDFKQT